MPNKGSEQLVKLSGAETTYGAVVETPTWGVIGLVTGGERSSKGNIENVFGIGSATAQAVYAKRGENNFNCDIVSPTAAILNGAVVRTAGALDSYNALVGPNGAARKLTGLKWNSLNIKVPEEGVMEASLEGIFKNLIIATVNETGHNPGTVKLWRRDGLVLTVAGAEDDGLVSMDIKISNNLERKGTDNATTNQKRSHAFLAEGNLNIDATIQTYTAPTFNLESDAYGCAAGDITVVATFTDMCGGASPSTLVITLTGGQYTEAKEPITPNKDIEYTIGINFTGITIA